MLQSYRKISDGSKQTNISDFTQLWGQGKDYATQEELTNWSIHK